MLPQLEKNQEILPSMPDQALFLSSVSREMLPFLLSLERVLDTLEATQEVPPHTNLHSRGTPRVSPQLKKSTGFPSSSQEVCPFPCFVGKGIQEFPSHLKKRRPKLDTREELQGSCHHFKRPQCPLSFHAKGLGSVPRWDLNSHKWHSQLKPIK